MHAYRTHPCAALTASHVGDTVRLSGWVHRKRDHGGVLFVDLRDHYGITQIVADSDSPALAILEQVRVESVVTIDGSVKARSAGTVNANLATGEIEVFARGATVLSAADELPMPVAGEQEYPEDIRLRYRFLDLRRETLHANIVRRTKVISEMRRRMEGVGFTEYSTPILTASSPEGARDFLVPSRIHPGKFYALPQAPQQYKQLLMMAGFDRYFQIAPCFRDEDPRADRLPGEFYQLDVEMSFVEQEDVFATMEPVITGVFEEFAEGRTVQKNWPRIPYAEAIAKYGSDKPDLRNPLIMQDVSEPFRGSGFKVFARILEGEKNRVWAIPGPKGGSRAFCDRMNSWAQGEGQPGLGYLMVKEDGEGQGPIANNIGPERVAAIIKQMGLKGGDACFFVAGDPDKFYKFAGSARNKVGQELRLIDENAFAFAWIVDFPMFEYNEDEKKVDFSHNPFSMPQGGLKALNEEDPLSLKAFQYDIACNGFELASGGIRNHRPEAMVKAFEIAGYGEETVIERFGGMYRAFQYGAPPHGGMAAGVDRIIMLLARATNLREVALFPMNQQAVDLLMGAPAEATPKQLREAHLRINAPEKNG